MTADERLARVQVKIDHADKHIAALDLTIREFLNKNPYKVGVRRDPETRSPAALSAGRALYEARRCSLPP
jgi:hypothetical protein